MRRLRDKSLRFDSPTVCLERRGQMSTRLSQRLRACGARPEGDLLFHLGKGPGTAELLPDLGGPRLFLSGFGFGIRSRLRLGLLTAGGQALEKQQGSGTEGRAESLQGEAGHGAEQEG